MGSKKQRKIVKKALNKALQDQHNLNQKLNPLPPVHNPYQAEQISLPHISLRHLRKQYRTRQTVDLIVNNTLTRRYANQHFRRIPLNTTTHTLIHGFDNAILAYRIPASTGDINNQLLESL